MDIGGQAVLNGVMLRHKSVVIVAVRAPDGKIVIKKRRVPQRSGILKWPIIRGVVGVYDMLRLGMWALMYSAEVSSDDEPVSKRGMLATVVIAMVFALGLFVALPYALTHFAGFSEDASPVVFNAVDGLIKAAILVGYLYIISLMPDVRTMFQYHGAEHAVVNCHEEGKPMVLLDAVRCRTAHPRCGTSFIFIVFLIMLVLFSIAPLLLANSDLTFWQRRAALFSIRLLLLVPVVGISYELLKLGGKHAKNPLMRLFILPGLLIQKLTALAPTKKQTEVALAAYFALQRKKRHQT